MIRLTERYEGYTELTQVNYDKFTKEGNVAVIFCREDTEVGERNCAEALTDFNELSSSCKGLKKAYVNIDRNPEIQSWDLEQGDWSELLLLEDGRPYRINIRQRPSTQLFGMIVCGFEIAFPNP
jgi:hypothetical protein